MTKVWPNAVTFSNFLPADLYHYMPVRAQLIMVSIAVERCRYT